MDHGLLEHLMEHDNMLHLTGGQRLKSIEFSAQGYAAESDRGGDNPTFAPHDHSPDCVRTA